MQSPLAARQGIAPSRVWLPAGPWLIMGEFLVQRFNHVAEADLRLRLERGDIVQSNGQAVRFHTPYKANQWLWYYRQVDHEVVVPFELSILYEDEQLVAVDKPHFMATTPGGQHLLYTALVQLRKRLNNMAITPLHRLDRDTAGVLLFCKQPALRGAYQQLFYKQEVEKDYEAIAPALDAARFPLHYKSRLEAPEGQLLMQEVDGEPNSDTYISVLAQWQHTTLGKLAWYRLQPLTGRKHQLRMHLLALGAPIVNDRYYPQGQPLADPSDFTAPLQLLARSIAFIDPVTHEYKQFSSQRRLAYLPEHLKH